MNFPADALPPSPVSQDPLLTENQDPLGLAAEDLGDLGLTGPGEEARPLVFDCHGLEDEGLWDTESCCAMCHDYAPVAPEPLHYKHVTVRGCCGSHEALNHLHPPPNDFLDRLFR